MEPIKKAKQAIQKAVETMKKIGKSIKFFMTPVGYVCAWIILIIFCVLLLYILLESGVRFLEQFIGIAQYDYITDYDLEILDQIQSAGNSTLDAQNFKEFRAFEYAVLIDVAEYIRNQKQEYFDIYTNQGEYKPEREYIVNHYTNGTADQKKQYSDLIKELEKY